MKTCPQCGACYEDETAICHRDDNRLVWALPGGCLVAERFYVEQRLGSGGSGTVYRATHVGTGRAVALKVLSTHLSRRPEWRGRFRREAAAAGRLKHPNIVDVTDFGTTEVGEQTVAFLAMEYLSGHPLTWYLRKGTLTPMKTAEWISEAAVAIDFAHQSGILHRDLKPDNIWIEELPGGGQRVKVLDFGLAKIFDPEAGTRRDSRPEERPGAREPGSESSEIEELGAEDLAEESPEPAPSAGTASRHPTVFLERPEEIRPRGATAPAAVPVADHGPVTELGTVMGTPAYMSPEQASGRPAAAASDVYALGVVAFEMLTGELPFSGTTQELLHHHRETPAPDPGSIRRGIPGSVRRAVLSALEKDPARRPATPLELARQLSGSFRVDELAGRAVLLYAALVVAWATSWVAVVPALGSRVDPLVRQAALRALATTNLVYFLALSLVLMLYEYRREQDATRLWPLCLLAFPLTPVWLLLVWLDRSRGERLDSPSGPAAPGEDGSGEPTGPGS